MVNCIPQAAGADPGVQVPGKNELQKCFKLFDFDSDG